MEKFQSQIIHLLLNPANPIEFICTAIFCGIVGVLLAMGKAPYFSYELANIMFFFVLIPTWVLNLKKRWIFASCLISYPLIIFFKAEAHVLFRWCCDLIDSRSHNEMINYIYLCDIVCLFIPLLLWLLVKTIKMNWAAQTKTKEYTYRLVRVYS